MKRLILAALVSLSLFEAKAQFPSTDSLRSYNIVWITNNAARAFTNYRLHTLLAGMIDWIDSARGGSGGSIGIDSISALNDSTLRYRINGTFRTFNLKGVYDTRRKLDTLYRTSDTTIAFRINDLLYSITIPGRINFADSIYRKAGKDSIFYRRAGVEYALKDSTGGGGANSNVGSGYRWVVVGTQNIKSVVAGYGQLIDSTTNANALTFKADTTGSNGLVTRSELRDSTDITTQVEAPLFVKLRSSWPVPDTLALDTTKATTRAWLYKVADSLISLMATAGITQLTGDVTAGPGSGSQATTIANNAVTNAKFRQSAGNSLIGKASSGTGNIADITATVANTYFTYDGSVIKADSVNYGHIKNAPPIFPGMYIAPAQSFNPGFLVIATAIIRPSNSFSLNNPILYEILDNSTGHNYSFIDSAYGHASNGRLVIQFPNVKNVLSMVINGDETFNTNGLQAGGPSIAFTNAEVAFFRPYTMGVRLEGDGTTTWTKVSGNGIGSLFTPDTYNTSTGVTGLNISPTYGADYSAIGFQYQGTNGYRIRLATSGLGSFNTGFILTDDFGNPVTTAPTSSDRVVITNAGTNMQQVGMTLWSATTNWMSSSANVWVIGFYEAWMVAAPSGSTAIQVRYQTTVSGATNYKIYRSTSKNGTYSLVHTGTDGIFTDGGLSANTVYYYKMYSTDGVTDTFITYFRTNTYFN